MGYKYDIRYFYHLKSKIDKIFSASTNVRGSAFINTDDLGLKFVILMNLITYIKENFQYFSFGRQSE